MRFSLYTTPQYFGHTAKAFWAQFWAQCAVRSSFSALRSLTQVQAVQKDGVGCGGWI